MTNFPGQVQVLSGDVYNGTPAQLQSFKNQTGATYPLLLLASTSTGGNLYDLYYPDSDDYIVINKVGIVRYHAADHHAHGFRYVLSELRGAIDTLVSVPTAVGDERGRRAVTLEVAPNPFASRIAIRLANATGAARPARITVHDLQGRRLAVPWDGPAAPGETLVEWDGRGADGSPVGAGLYLVRAELGGETLVRRVVRIR